MTDREGIGLYLEAMRRACEGVRGFQLVRPEGPDTIPRFFSAAEAQGWAAWNAARPWHELARDGWTVAERVGRSPLLVAAAPIRSLDAPA